MRKVLLVAGLLLLLVGLHQAGAFSSSPTFPPAIQELPLPGEDRQTFRLIVGSPRLVPGEYPVRVSAAPEAELRTRPWMDAQLASSDLDGTTWQIKVPEAPPYLAHIERQPREPVSGLMLDLSASYRGKVHIQISEQSVSFRTGEVRLGHPQDLKDGLIRIERVPTAITVARTSRDEDYPSLAAASDGALWMGWIEFDGRADVLRVMRWKDETQTDYGPIAGPGDLYRVQLAEENNRFWVIWAEQREENWDLYGRTFAEGNWSEIFRLTENPYPDWNHRVAVDPAGRLWLVWQGGVRQNDRVNSEIFLRFFENERWSPSLNVSNHPANDWEPALAVQAGRAYLAWDSYRNGNYDLFLATADGMSLSSPRPLVATARTELRADLVRDSQGRLWFSWEEAGPNWGKDSVAFERGLHRERRVRVACLEGTQTYVPQSELQPSSLPHLGGQTEMARLALDSQGRLWLFFRVNFLNRIWQQAAAFLEGDEWSQPIVFDHSFGRQTAPLAVTTAGNELLVSWVSDTRVSQSAFNALHNDVHLAQISPASPDVPPALDLRPAQLQEPGASTAWVRAWPDHALELRGKIYHLFWGELHRHTDIDHHGRPDGALEDAYRYALDAAQMDFFATTDHIHGEPLRSGVNALTWWRAQKYADLHRFTGGFEPLYAYERSKGSPGGHKNLIFARRGGPLLKGTEGNNVPTDLWNDLDRAPFQLVVIPHQLTGPAINWRYHNSRYEPVMEIYQGRRQSYEYDGAPQPPGVRQVFGKKEGSWAWDALEQGVRLGFIASSDHGSTHMSYAALYAEDLSRDSLLEALKAKRTYAASDNIILDFRLKMSNRQILMGESTLANGQPEIYIKAIGTAPIQTIEVIRNNRFVYKAEPGEREVELTYVVTEPINQTTYFYVRLIQQDGHMAWSSPIWLELTHHRGTETQRK